MLRGKAKKDYQKKYMERKRSNISNGSNKVTDDVGLTEYPAILKALVDPIKRVKLEKIYQSLSDFKQAENVYYGCRNPIPFDVAGELLEITGGGRG